MDNNNRKPYNIFTFINESNYPGQDSHKVTFETSAVTLDGVTQAFETFLKGCGYGFHSLDINMEDPDSFVQDPTPNHDTTDDEAFAMEPKSGELVGYYDEHGVYHAVDDGE